MKHILNILLNDEHFLLRLIPLLISVLLLSFIFYEYITGTCGILLMYSLPLGFLFALISISIPTTAQSKYVSKKLIPLAIWFSTLVFSCISFYLYDLLKNLSPVLYSTEFYWEEGVYLDFRENLTFKAINADFESEISYGTYEMKDSFIILKDDVYFGMSKMKDTLFIQDDGIKFELQKPWRVNSGVLRFRKIP